MTEFSETALSRRAQVLVLVALTLQLLWLRCHVLSDASTFHHCRAYDGLSLRRRRTLAALVDIVFCCAINETVCVGAISGLFFRVDSRLTRIISRFLSKLNCKL